MKVLLAGYNIDTQVMKELVGRRKLATLTPETISAAYARISRSRKAVDELRTEARQEIGKSRKSNRRIIFEMGHHSVAEHAVFNFDVIGISRRAVEDLENFRLGSYTEKSQRYVTLKGDYVIPEELRKTQLVSQFRDMVELQNRLYREFYQKLFALNIKKFAGKLDVQKNARLLENLAKEDARYCLAMATQTQLGATFNARNLELVIRRFASHRLEEIRALGRMLFRAVEKIAPSVILFHRANDYDQRTYAELARYIRGSGEPVNRRTGDRENNVKLVAYTPGADEKILAALLFRVKRTDYSQCLRLVKKMLPKARLGLFKKALRHMELYDVVLREFEMADLTFSLTVSAGCFGQLKRHRLATIISQEYDPHLGITIPESVREIDAEKDFLGVITKTEALYTKIERTAPGIGSYILTNAHRKRILMKMNMRELYHISRMREDPTAQWDIRHLTEKMCRLAREVAPVTGLLLGGKTGYPSVYLKLYGKNPKIVEVPEIK